MAIKKSELYSSLWKSCDELRGGMDASQYKDYVLVLLFIKYVSDKYAGNPNALIEVPEGGGFKDMVALKNQKDIGDQINKIIGKLAEANNLKGVIDVADFNDADKLGRGQEMVDRLSNLVRIFEDSRLDFSRNRAEGDDILGDAYEYLIIKNLHLAVYPPTGRVRIATPLKIDDESVRLYAISKLSWIKKQRLNFEMQERQTKREYVSGESHYFEGNRYLLNVINRNAAPNIEIRNKKYIDLYVRPDSTPEQRERMMTKWYRQSLKEKVPALLEKWQAIVGVQVNDWEVKQMKTKWGTCKIEARRIWLNLELAKKPVHCLEYIILHELVHLLERHHNERFITLMDKFMPRWSFHQAELNRQILSYND